MLESVILVLYFPLDESEQFFVVVDTFVNGWVLPLVLGVCKQILLHVVDHVCPIHVVRVEIRSLQISRLLSTVHVIWDRSRRDH